MWVAKRALSARNSSATARSSCERCSMPASRQPWRTPHAFAIAASTTASSASGNVASSRPVAGSIDLNITSPPCSRSRLASHIDRQKEAHIALLPSAGDGDDVSIRIHRPVERLLVVGNRSKLLAGCSPFDVHRQAMRRRAEVQAYGRAARLADRLEVSGLEQVVAPATLAASALPAA